LLQAAGLPELVTASLEDYEALAFALAIDRERLQAVRGKPTPTG
jgi:predicted O-linked N-acetylglucosamine transferase (SPINDLY family)